MVAMQCWRYAKNGISAAGGYVQSPEPPQHPYLASNKAYLGRVYAYDSLVYVSFSFCGPDK
jgi:hypothetical protein